MGFWDDDSWPPRDPGRLGEAAGTESSPPGGAAASTGSGHGACGTGGSRAGSRPGEGPSGRGAVAAGAAVPGDRSVRATGRPRSWSSAPVGGTPGSGAGTVPKALRSAVFPVTGADPGGRVCEGRCAEDPASTSCPVLPACLRPSRSADDLVAAGGRPASRRPCESAASCDVGGVGPSAWTKSGSRPPWVPAPTVPVRPATGTTGAVTDDGGGEPVPEGRVSGCADRGRSGSSPVIPA